MAQLKALRKDEDLAAVPLDQPVLVDLEPEGAAVEIDEPEVPVKQQPKTDAEPAKTGVNVLEEQLKALQEANRIEKEKRIAAERKAEESDRERVAAVNSQSRTEADAMQSGLAAAQAEQASAKAALKVAFEAGDAEGLADAQVRIGRTAADIREFERSAALLADRKEQAQEQPRQQAQQQQPGDINAMIDGNPQLLAEERVWLKAHPEAVMDPSRNKELDVAYIKATRQGLSRGTPAYFKFIEQEMGYSAPNNQQQEDNGMSVSAPVSRNERGSDGRPSGGKIMLTPEQRDIAKSMGVSDIEYARQVATFDAARKSDPMKYGDR